MKSNHLIASDYKSDLSLLSQNKLVDVNINDKTQLFIGKKNINYTSLTYAQDYNKGIVGSVQIPNLNSHLKTFTASTDKLDDTDLGIEDHNNRASGIIWEYQPELTTEEKIHFSTSYFSGESEENNHTGDAISVSSQASALKQQLQIRGEYAQSTFTSLDKYAEQNNHLQQAQHFSVHYIPSTKNKNSSWDIGLEKKTVEAGFQSVLNDSLVGDKDTTRLFGHYQKNNWTTEYNLQREANNLERKLSTTDTIYSGSLTFRHQADQATLTNKNPFLGNRHYSLHYNQSNKIQHYHWQNNSESPDGNRNQYQALIFEGRHHYDDWLWFYKIGRSTAYDRLDDNGHFRSHELEIGSHFSVTQLTRIHTTIRSLQSRKTRTDLSSSEMHYNVQLHHIFAPDNVSGKLNLNYHQRDTEVNLDQNENHRTFIFSGSASQRLLKPRGIVPGIDLDVSASYLQDRNAYAEINNREYQAKITLKIDLTPNHGSTIKTRSQP